MVETLESLIGQNGDAREVKRALCVKMRLEGMTGVKVASLLGVSEQYVSKWRTRFLQNGVLGLRLGYRGGQKRLSAEQEALTLSWLHEQRVVSVELLRDYLEGEFGVVYRSRQSYGTLLHAAQKSYHKSQKSNPKRDEAVVLERREAIKKTHTAQRTNPQW